MATANAAQESGIFNTLYPDGYRPYRLKWYDILIAFLVFIIVLIGYIRTLTPSMGAGDNGELVTAIYNMGACHPPGYPLYSIVGKLFTFIPVGDIAYRVNLFVACSGAGAVLFLYLIAVKLIGLNRDRKKLSLSIHLPAVCAALVFGFSNTHWGQATGGEVYPLNVFLVSFLLFIIVLWYEEIIYFRNEPRLHFAERMTVFLFFAMGLSITNHQLPLWYIVAAIVFIFLGAIVIVVSERGKKFYDELKARLPFLITFGIIGLISVLLFYVYAVSSRLIPPLVDNYNQVHMDLIYILVAMFMPPVYLTVYTIAVKMMKLEDNWVDNLFRIMCYAVWLMYFAVTIYLYLMVRAVALAPLPDPKPFSWGDTQTLDILLNHMLRKQYGLGGGKDFNNFFGQLGAVWSYMVDQFHWVNFIFAGIGVVYMFIRDKLWTLFTLAAMSLLTFSLIKFINFEIDPRTLSFQVVFFIQNFLVLAVYIAFGYQFLIDAANWIAAKLGKKGAVVVAKE